MADKLVNQVTGRDGLPVPELMLDQSDGSFARQIGFGALRSSLDSIAVVQSTPGPLGAPWFVELSDGTRVMVLGSDGALRISSEGGKATYSVGMLGIVPGTAATDIFTIRGFGGKIVKPIRIVLTGTATAAGLIDVALIKRSALNTSGTPGAAAGVPHNAGFAAASAVVEKWTGTPPSLGAAVGTLRVDKLLLNNATTPAGNDRLVWEFNGQGHHVDLISAVEQLAVNLNGATIQSGNLINAYITWTEE